MFESNETLKAFVQKKPARVQVNTNTIERFEWAVAVDEWFASLFGEVLVVDFDRVLTEFPQHGPVDQIENYKKSSFPGRT